MHHKARRLWPSIRRMRGRRGVLTAAAACVVALAAGSTAVADVIFDQSPPTHGTKRTYKVVTAVHSGLHLNVPEASTANGTQIIQWGGHGFMNAQWETLTVAPDRWALRNRWSRQCLDVDSKADGAPVIQRPCDGSISQQWTGKGGVPQGGSSHGGAIMNVWSGLDLNVVGASKAPGAKLMQFHRVPGAPNALFTFTSAQDVVD